MPSISVARICNMALSHIGTKSTIEDINQLDAEAGACRLWYDWSREQALEYHNWSFARRRRSVAYHTDAVPTGHWMYRYEYPSDAIKIRHIQNPGGPDADEEPFHVETAVSGEEKTILANVPEATFVYTFDQILTGMYTGAFVDALSWRLAHHIAMPLTGDEGVVKTTLQVYDVAIQRAAMLDASEDSEREERDAAHIRARD